MSADEQVEKVISVRGETCAVTAVLSRGRWKASGSYRGKVVEILRAATAEQAFEWWTNKATMQARE